MPSLPPLHDHLLLQSNNLYYLVTTKQGAVLKTNNAALALAPYQIFETNEVRILLENLVTQSTIKRTSINASPNVCTDWEVHSVQCQDNEFIYQWIAPVVANEATENDLLFQKNPLPSWLINIDTGTILKSNDAATAMYGYSGDEFRESKFNQIFSAPDADNKKLIDWANVASGDEVMSRLFKKDSSEVKATLHCTRLLYHQKEVVMVSAVVATKNNSERNKTVNDIEARKEMGERSLQLANLVDQAADGLTAVDLELKPLTWNKAAEEIYGLLAEEIIGRNLRDLISFQYKNATPLEMREQLLRDGFWRGEMFFTRPKDQKAITLTVHFKLLRDENGLPHSYVVSGTNITEQIKTESKLDEIEKRFEEVADAAPVGIWMCDVNNKLTYVNKHLLKLTGTEKQQFLQLPWSSLLHPEDGNKMLEKFEYHIKNRLSLTQEYMLKNGDGAYRWVQYTAIPRVLEDGTFLGFIGSVADIHDTKLQEDKLQYQAMVLDNVSDIIISTDLYFKVKSWNKIAEKYFGLTEANATGKSFVDLVQFDYGNTTRPEVLNILNREGKWQGEVTFTNGNNETIYLLHTITYIFNADGVKIGAMAVSRDITERKVAEEKVRQSELFYRNLTAASLDGVLLTSEEGTITFASPSISHILGYDAEEVMGLNCFDFVHPEDGAWALESFQREVSENPTIKSVIIRLHKKDGEWVWCLVRGHNLLQNPFVKSIAIYFHDDSLRKQATDALKQSEQRFRTLIRDVQVGVLLQDFDGTILMSNKSFGHMLEVEEEEIIGKKLWEIYPTVVDEQGKFLSNEEKPSYRAMKTKKAVNALIGILWPEENKTLWVIVNADPVLDDQNNILNIVCSFTNITERKELEQKLLLETVNNQKLLTQATIDGQEKERREIGKELHDNIGQQLTTIKLYLDMAKTSNQESSLEMILLSLHNVSDVINEIRRMSRSLMPPTLGDLGLIESINDLIESLNRTQKLEIEFDYFEFDEEMLPENGRLMVFRILQEQMNNIVKHANATKIFIVLRHTSKLMVLEIKDNGCGFELNTVRKGLGLANIKNRAELFGGQVEVSTAPNQGCILKVIVPNALQPAIQ